MFILMNSVFVSGQKVDSLKRLAAKASGSALCSTFYQIGYELVDVNFNEALDYAEKSISCAKQSGDTLQLVRGVQLKAIAFRRLGEIDSSNRIITAILPTVRKKMYSAELHDLLHGLALGFLFTAQFDESLKYNFECLEIRKKYGSAFQIGSTLFNIGFVYYKLADYPKALEYYSQSLKELTSDPHDGKLIERLLVNIALSYAYSGDTEKANSYVEDVLRRCGNNCSSAELQNISFCRGIVSLNRGDSAGAKVHFLESYIIAKADKNERLELDNIVYLSRIYLGSEDMVQAEHYLRIAEELIQQGVSYNMELMKVYHEFAALHERKGDLKSVVHFLRRYMALKDSIYDDEVTTRLMRIEAAHIEQEKNAKIETQNRMLVLNAEVISRQRIATIFAFTTIVLLIGVVILSVRSIREKRRRNVDLEGRVKNRTVELEAIAHQSHKSLAENKVWMEKIVSSVRHTTNTVNGLSSLVTKDPESSEKCIRLIEYEMSQLLTHVSGYAFKSDERGKDFRSVS